MAMEQEQYPAAASAAERAWDEQQRWWAQYEQQNPAVEKLRAHLSFGVPLRILALRRHGGPSPDDVERVRGYASHPGLYWGEGTAWGEDEADGNTNTLLCHGAEALLFPAEFSQRARLAGHAHETGAR